MLPKDKQLRRIVEQLRDDEYRRIMNINNVVVVANNLDRCKVLIRDLKKWLSGVDIKSRAVTTTNHMEGYNFFNSMIILYGDWYVNKKIRGYITSEIEKFGLVHCSLDDTEPYPVLSGSG